MAHEALQVTLPEHGAITPSPPLVIDTNVVLDLWVWTDPRAQPLAQVLQATDVCWLATPAMREELRRVLDYPHIVQRLQRTDLRADAVLERMDARVQWCEVPPKAPFTCRDPDDQKFIDLAAAHAATLISRDRAVLRMARRLQRLGAQVLPEWVG